MLELEWQYFRKQVGDDTTVIPNKEEFVKTITTLLITVVVLPSAIISYAVLVSATSPGGLLSGGGRVRRAHPAGGRAVDRLEAGRKGGARGGGKITGPGADADLLRSLWPARRLGCDDE